MSVETTASRFDSVKWILVFILVAVAVVGNSYFSDQSLLYRVLGILALAAVAGLDSPADRQGRSFLGTGKGLPHRDSEGGLAHPTGNRADHHDRGGICIAGGADSLGA